MPDCPECGGELIAATDQTDSEGTHRVFECENCNTMYEVDEIETT